MDSNCSQGRTSYSGPSVDYSFQCTRFSGSFRFLLTNRLKRRGSAGTTFVVFLTELEILEGLFLTEMTTLKLLQQEALIKTGEFDHADWNYRPLLGGISRSRFSLVKDLIAGRQGKRIMEVGYGSGVFLPELANHCEEVYGVDVHDKNFEVAETLAKLGTKANLISSGAEKIEVQDNYFDFIVAVSALEFVSDLDAVCLEMRRTLAPGGSVLIVTPRQSPILDFGLKLLTGKSAKDDFGDRREKIIPTLKKYFEVEQNATFPKFKSSPIKLYTALELKPRALTQSALDRFSIAARLVP